MEIAIQSDFPSHEALQLPGDQEMPQYKANSPQPDDVPQGNSTEAVFLLEDTHKLMVTGYHWIERETSMPDPEIKDLSFQDFASCNRVEDRIPNWTMRFYAVFFDAKRVISEIPTVNLDGEVEKEFTIKALVRIVDRSIGEWLGRNIASELTWRFGKTHCADQKRFLDVTLPYFWSPGLVDLLKDILETDQIRFYYYAHGPISSPKYLMSRFKTPEEILGRRADCSMLFDIASKACSSFYNWVDKHKLDEGAKSLGLVGKYEIVRVYASVLLKTKVSNRSLSEEAIRMGVFEPLPQDLWTREIFLIIKMPFDPHKPSVFTPDLVRNLPGFVSFHNYTVRLNFNCRRACQYCKLNANKPHDLIGCYCLDCKTVGHNRARCPKRPSVDTNRSISNHISIDLKKIAASAKKRKAMDDDKDCNSEDAIKMRLYLERKRHKEASTGS